MANELLSYKELLPNLYNLAVRSVVATEKGWMVEAEGQRSAICPSCGVASHSRHSRYWRQVKDLALQGTAVTLKLRMGRWRCRTQCVGARSSPSGWLVSWCRTRSRRTAWQRPGLW